ncbi:hypothetical protein D3C80_855020 [compost metagenome]
MPLYPACLLYGEANGVFTGDEAVAHPSLGQIAQLIFADGCEGDIEKPLHTRVVDLQRITVVASANIRETLKTDKVVERTID